MEQMGKENPLDGDYVTIAEISNPWGKDSYRHIYTLLIKPEKLEEILNYQGNIPHKIEANGPYPFPSDDPKGFKPQFFVDFRGFEPDIFEPLIHTWSAAGRTLIMPNIGLTMTYGLIPRLIASDTGDVCHWDNLGKPLFDVIKCKQVSHYNYNLVSDAYIKIKKEYLIDYASLCKRSIIQIYYVDNTSSLNPIEDDILNGEEFKKFNFKGRQINIIKRLDQPSLLISKAWGIRHLLDPSDYPISGDRNNGLDLIWPGIKKSINGDSLGGWMPYVYLRDAFLQKYEDRPDLYEIYPKSAGVDYGAQWGLNYCRRIGRDLVQVELKKLCESVPFDEVEYLNKFAVDPPSLDKLSKLRKELNIADRAKNLTDAFLNLGDVLADFVVQMDNDPIAPFDFISLDKREMEYRGWWTEPTVKPITHHIELSIGKDSFLNRCKALYKLVVENLQENHIRKILIQLGIDGKSIKSLRSLKLLNILLTDCLISKDTGLNILNDFQEIEERRLEDEDKPDSEKQFPSPMLYLFLLNKLRQKDAHIHTNIDDLMQELGIDMNSIVSGWGIELDKLYDKLAITLEDASTLINNSIYQD